MRYLIGMGGKALRRTLESEGIRSRPILEAIERVPRELFVPPESRGQAYVNAPLPIGEGQTVSQPYTVAVMLELAGVEPGKKVLEVGSGSGYAAAVIAEAIGDQRKVIGLEVRGSLAEGARKHLAAAGYGDVRILIADGRLGYEDEAPYDAIIVSAEAQEVPETLRNQLAEGGNLVVPVREGFAAVMKRVRLTKGEYEESDHGAFSFVPLVGPSE